MVCYQYNINYKPRLTNVEFVSDISKVMILLDTIKDKFKQFPIRIKKVYINLLMCLLYIKKQNFVCPVMCINFNKYNKMLSDVNNCK